MKKGLLDLPPPLTPSLLQMRPQTPLFHSPFMREEGRGGGNKSSPAKKGGGGLHPFDERESQRRCSATYTHQCESCF